MYSILQKNRQHGLQINIDNLLQACKQKTNYKIIGVSQYDRGLSSICTNRALHK